MASKNAGIMLEIIDGVNKGRFAIALASMQREEFSNSGKMFVRFYYDHLCLKPIMSDRHPKFPKVGLVSIDYCKQIGYVD